MSNVYPLKCRITNAADDSPVRVDVYDDIGYGGWFDEGLTAKSFAAQMAGIKGSVEVHINSAGGDVFDGIAIGNAIKAHAGKTTGIVDGLAASIASVIFQACGSRLVQEGGMVMIHDAFSYCVGNADDMAKEAEILNGVSDNIANLYAAKSGKTAEFWRGEMKAERWYDAQHAVDAGLADGIASDAKAELPAGLNLADFANIPSRIAARLRSMPVAMHGARPKAAGHPHDGTHSHSHSAYGAAGGDDDGMHTHPHSHGNDGDHGHSHSDAPADHAHGPQAHGSGPEQTCADLGHQCCQDAASAKALLAGLVSDAVDVRISAAAGKPGTHGDHERWDPDGDGDCDADPEGDTDNSHWNEEGEQIQSVPGSPMEDRLTRAGVKALFDEWLAGIRDAGGEFDESDWDASKAWSAGAASDDPAAFYDGICAGKKAGDPATQDAHALPYKYSPGAKANAAGVKAALSRLPQTDGLTNATEAKSLLQKLMKQISPDYDPEDSAGDGPGFTATDDDFEQFRAALEGAKA